MVTHDSRYANHADRIVHLFDGIIVDEESGTDRREMEDAKREVKERDLAVSRVTARHLVALILVST